MYKFSEDIEYNDFKLRIEGDWFPGERASNNSPGEAPWIEIEKIFINIDNYKNDISSLFFEEQIEEFLDLVYNQLMGERNV